MTSIPQAAIDAVLRIYPRMPVPVAIRVLEAAEEVWPHDHDLREALRGDANAQAAAKARAAITTREAPDA